MPEKMQKLHQLGMNLNWYYTGDGEALTSINNLSDESKPDDDVQKQLSILRRAVSDLQEFVQEAKIKPNDDYSRIIGTCFSKEKANNRLKEFIKECYNNNIASIARVMGVTRQSLSLYLKKDVSIGNKFLEKIEQAGANPLWIEYGIGPMRNEIDIDALKQTPTPDEADISISEWRKIKNLESLSKQELIELSKNINKLVEHEEHK
jgi:transcriptional regulator with XRE-family HTH domain